MSWLNLGSNDVFSKLDMIQANIYLRKENYLNAKNDKEMSEAQNHIKYLEYKEI